MKQIKSSHIIAIQYEAGYITLFPFAFSLSLTFLGFHFGLNTSSCRSFGFFSLLLLLLFHSSSKLSLPLKLPDLNFFEASH